MERGRLVIGYREVTLTAAGPLGPAGTSARGHEFHGSKLGAVPASVPRLYTVSDSQGGTPRAEGFVVPRHGRHDGAAGAGRGAGLGPGEGLTDERLEPRLYGAHEAVGGRGGPARGTQRH